VLTIRDVAPVNKRLASAWPKRLAEAKDWAVPFIDSSCSRVQTSGGSVRTYFRKLETRLHFLRQRRYGRRARHASGDLWEDQDQRAARPAEHRRRKTTESKGQALWAYQRRFPHGHWKTITLVAGLRQDAILAPFVIDGPLDGKIFRTYVERCLAPTLDRGDIVFMDNLQTHKVVGVTEAIEVADAMAIYLPAYSPDFNPIEQVFSKLKAILRKAAERTIPGLWRRIRSILRTVSKKECLNFFRRVGYEKT
jgi:transposase